MAQIGKKFGEQDWWGAYFKLFWFLQGIPVYQCWNHFNGSPYMDEVSVTMIAQYMKMQWLKSISNLGNEGIVKYRMKSKQLRWGVWSKKPLCRNYYQASIKMPLEAKGCKSSILEKMYLWQTKVLNVLLLRPFQTTTAGLAWSARDRRWWCWSWRWWCWSWWWSCWSWWWSGWSW